MDQQEDLNVMSSADENSDEDESSTESWENVEIPTSECPTCKSSLIPSTTVFYHGALKNCVPINPLKDENNVSSTENQNQAAETKTNSLWCKKCEVNFVTVNKEEKGLRRNDNKGVEDIGQLGSWLPGFLGSISPLSYLTQDVHIVKVSSFITGQTFGAFEALMEKVKKNKIPAILVEEVNPKNADAFLVICPITSRVGSDVESAMKITEASSLDKPTILVLMHHTRDSDYSTAGAKWCEVYDNVKLDVHVFFHETIPGLLTCQQNDQAIEAIEKKLYAYSTPPSFSSYLYSTFSLVSSYLYKSSHTSSQHV